MKTNLYKVFGRGSLFVSTCVAIFGMLAACSDSGSDDIAGGTSEDAGITAVTDWEVAGVTQKGPFVTGSAVTVQELDGITLKQTGKSFKGSIKSDKGDFAIKDIDLKSQYAILEASGYYRDEISGKKSTGTVTLRALTDLSNRKTVNINLLTHLEYERVMYLVTEKKKPIAEAKAQADKEILAAFNIAGDFGESEDLNIFESGDGNAALLAISVLMQADVDVAGLTERMGEFSIAVAEGGAWEDADAKTVIADWACDADLMGTLANVRKNVEGWKYADTVPAFEKFVTNYWWENYGLGQCTEKREGEVKRNVNKLSKMYDKYFACEKGRWHIPGEEPVSSSSSNQDSSGKSFGTMKDSRDGKEYKTVRIGNQVWMAENLNYAAEGSLCYGDDEKNCEKYGRLYDWDIALDTTSEECGKYFYKCTLKSDFYPRQGVCPDGWHLPDKGEWMDLVEYARDNSHEDSVAYSLQSYYWDDDWERQYGTDKFGFNAMPAGMFDGENYVGLDSLTDFWTSSNTETFGVGNMINTVDYVILRKKDSEIWYYGADLGWALSVRCVKGTGKKRGSSDGSSSSAASSSSVYNPYVSSSSSSVEQKKDTLPDLPDELAFVEDFLEKKTEYTEYAEGAQIMWRGQSPALWGACDSVATELINEAAGKGFEYEGVYSNDSLDNDYTEDSYVYVRTSGGKVYTLVITKGEVRVWTTLGFTMPSAMFYVKLIVREEGADEIPTEMKKDYDSPKYREIPEDLKFVLDSTQYHYRYYSNDQKWTSWNCYTRLGSSVGASNDDYFDEAKAKADEYALMMEAHGFTLKSQETLTIDDLESMQYTEYAKSDYDGELTFYRFEKEVEKFRYEAEVFAVVDYYRDLGAEGYLFRARINITIYDK
ncbi:FISUMP domain-containing protein [Fibrobacter sp. UBA4309]|uniref:FISUMP domain-containing protein n=1 Tax=Fibrobacter sp. UBA4309 TaxID=1946537 RepID=UPI0025B8520A|nr:FISUMP domain-containing protein [Fibrobacter sp. UBA4309]